MERLTLKDSSGVYCPPNIPCETRCDDCKHLDNMMNKLAQYEEAEEKGLILWLPVAEGSTVYTVKDYLDCEYGYNCPLGYAEGKNDCEKGFCCEHEYKKYFMSETKFNHMMLDKISKTVFLTKEEAEQALQKLSAN